MTIHRIVLYLLFFVAQIQAKEFDTFFKEILEQAPEIKASNIDPEIVKHENALRMRMKNPEIESELALYDPNNASVTEGYGIMLTQELRLPRLESVLRSQNRLRLHISKLRTQNKIAAFRFALERAYIDYVYYAKHHALLKRYAKKMKRAADLVKRSYKLGAESKVAYLSAKVAYERFRLRLMRAKEAKELAYLTLLKLAQTKRKPKIDTAFLYPISYRLGNPPKETLRQALAQKNLQLAETITKHSQILFERIELFAGSEKEPEQSSFRFGISLPLPLWHTKQEEQRIAKLKAMQAHLQAQQEHITLKQSVAWLRKKATLLSKRYKETLMLLQKEKRLTKLLQKGYKHYQENLFEWLRKEQSLLETELSLLTLYRQFNHTASQYNAIIQGANHD